MQVRSFFPYLFFLFDNNVPNRWFVDRGIWLNTVEFYQYETHIKTWSTEKEAETFLKEWIKTHPEEFAESVARTLET